MASMLKGTIGSPRDYKTWFKILHRGLWTPHKIFLAGGAATGACPCCSATEGGTVHFLAEYPESGTLMDAFAETCDSLHYEWEFASSHGFGDLLYGEHRGEKHPIKG